MREDGIASIKPFVRDPDAGMLRLSGWFYGLRPSSNIPKITHFETSICCHSQVESTVGSVRCAPRILRWSGERGADPEAIHILYLI
jgi:hypothetical protein